MSTSRASRTSAARSNSRRTRSRWRCTAGLGALAPVIEQQDRRRLVADDALALTPSQTCRMLGIDKRALAELISEKLIRVVSWRGRYRGATNGRRWRVPRAEVERLCEEGIPEPGERGRRRAAPKKRHDAEQDAAALRRLDLKDL